ncbi:unnamed protein product [Ilex paraguariensis]|uniref:Uncharacterized protein n=1 Tax=Ilex paraguariensis TaxID=185542 RepID=A0ABC8RVP4_9AQUA
METRKPKNHQMGASKANIQCKKHPKHRQSPGICSVCLREKLSQLSTSSRSNTATTISSCSSSSLSSLSSSNASSYSSPVHRNHRVGLERRGSVGFTMNGRNVLSKSMSMAAFVPRRREGERRDQVKKSSFWSKFLRPKNKGMDECLMHSRTMRERVITRVQ